MTNREFFLALLAELVLLVSGSTMIISSHESAKHDIRKSSTIYHMEDVYKSEGEVEYITHGKYSHGRDLSFYDLKTGNKITLSPPFKVVSNQ